ncbi:hypothetical protein LB566_25080 [Mesorhizobium sp. CA13]|uniref:hypothetical protein n=1 Tax=Mesorhizobium sp. CA13 TaxID=2876643 RepID=UPI001CCA5507|nr:hypothetical protein [Mesorhizobium sp. CA13]MBZ9857070.1 hypothetical protein [Mesorhizobium sp. CA13]
MESEALRPPKLLLEKCFGKNWRWRRKISTFMTALEGNLASGVASARRQLASYLELDELCGRAICDIKEYDVDEKPAAPESPVKAKEIIKDMSFKMELSWHTEFKKAAADANLSMTELLRESFELWKQKRGN